MQEISHQDLSQGLPTFFGRGEIELPRITFDRVNRALNAVSQISRTFQGVSDTSVSDRKEKLLIEGEDLVAKVSHNFQSTLTRLLAHQHLSIDDGADALKLIQWMSCQLNYGLVTPERPWLRDWDTGLPSHSAPGNIAQDLIGFCEELAERFSSWKRDPITHAAWVEKRFNAQIHPLNDGCGRLAKALAAYILISNDCEYPKFESRERYFELISESFDTWTREYRSRASVA